MRATTQATLALIQDTVGRVLLGMKKDAKLGNGKWNLPGGEVEEDETILAAAARETDEEVGVTVEEKDLRHIGFLECFAGTEFFQRVHLYRAARFTGEPRETDSMIPRWFTHDGIPYFNMHEGDRFWLPLALRGELFRIRIQYERPGEGYISHEMLDYAK